MRVRLSDIIIFSIVKFIGDVLVNQYFNILDNGKFVSYALTNTLCLIHVMYLMREENNGKSI